MVRIGVGLAIIATIFMRSPHRSDADLLPDAAALARIQADVAAAALRSGIGQTLAEATLRRTLDGQAPHAPSTPSPAPARDGTGR